VGDRLEFRFELGLLQPFELEQTKARCSLGEIATQLGTNLRKGGSERIGQAREARCRRRDDQRDEHDILNETLSGLVVVELLKTLNQGSHLL